MWMQHRFARLADFAAVARDVGFGGIEVSHIITPAMIGDADVAGMGIRAVHFPAPKVPSPFGQPAEALVSSNDETARRWAVDQGLRSIDLAVEAGARVVCLHLGQVPGLAHREWALEQRFRAGQAGSQVFVREREAVQRERQNRAAAALEAAQRSLDDLATYAAPRGVRLGIESRVHFWQIPTWSELGKLLSQSDPKVVGFWYDCGHVQVLHNLGFHEHNAWLEAYGQRVVGAHFHDVTGLRDHLLPGQGEIDFEHIGALLPSSIVWTCEFDWYFDIEEVTAGGQYLLRALTGAVAA
jgi:sugar phosphate isomerase/epimerase